MYTVIYYNLIIFITLVCSQCCNYKNIKEIKSVLSSFETNLKNKIIYEMAFSHYEEIYNLFILLNFVTFSFFFLFWHITNR